MGHQYAQGCMASSPQPAVTPTGIRDGDPAALAALDRPLPTTRPPLYGDGHAGDRVVEALLTLDTGRKGV